MARNRQTAWRVEVYRQEIRDHGGLLAETRGQEGTAFPDRRVFRHGGFVAVRGQAHAPQAAPYRQTRVRLRLVEEEGFEGSYSSVQRYVKRWREEHRSDGDGYLELDWSGGVMRVDFGEAVATIGGGDVRGVLPWSPRFRIRTCGTWPRCRAGTRNACARGWPGSSTTSAWFPACWCSTTPPVRATASRGTR